MKTFPAGVVRKFTVPVGVIQGDLVRVSVIRAGVVRTYLGPVGYPGVPDHDSLWRLLLLIQRTFQQYINWCPAKQLRGIELPLAGRGPEDVDMLIVRESNEGNALL